MLIIPSSWGSQLGVYHALLVSALELPVVVKNNSDLNKNCGMFKLNCHVWYA
jgi:hypothetical protein